MTLREKHATHVAATLALFATVSADLAYVHNLGHLEVWSLDALDDESEGEFSSNIIDDVDDRLGGLLRYQKNYTIAIERASKFIDSPAKAELIDQLRFDQAKFAPAIAECNLRIRDLKAKQTAAVIADAKRIELEQKAAAVCLTVEAYEAGLARAAARAESRAKAGVGKTAKRLAKKRGQPSRAA